MKDKLTNLLLSYITANKSPLLISGGFVVSSAEEITECVTLYVSLHADSTIHIQIALTINLTFFSI